MDKLRQRAFSRLLDFYAAIAFTSLAGGVAGTALYAHFSGTGSEAVNSILPFSSLLFAIGTLRLVSSYLRLKPIEMDK